MHNTYTVSARGKQENEPIAQFLHNNFGNLPLQQIDSVFGFVERSTMYGGRMFFDRQLSDADIQQLKDTGIGLRIPFTNHAIERQEYEANRALLEKYHAQLNSVIVTNDDLAGWIRQDFPYYAIEASVIKNITSMRKLQSALGIYDTVVLPMILNYKYEFLKSIEDKDRIRLFANAGCALTCPSRICYASVSVFNKFEGGEFQCSQSLKKRELMGMVDFDIEALSALGFHRFKLLRARPGNMTGY